MVSVASALYLTDNFDLPPYRVGMSDEGVTLETSALETTYFRLPVYILNSGDTETLAEPAPQFLQKLSTPHILKANYS